MGEGVGVARPAGEDLWGSSGLEMLPRLQSRKQPFLMGLEENWPCREKHHIQQLIQPGATAQHPSTPTVEGV